MNRNTSLPGSHPHHADTFAIRMCDVDRHGRATMASLCTHLQEVATAHGHNLGFGLEALAKDQRTWMLSRIIVDLKKPLRWRDTLHLQTWPSSVRNSLLAMRDFVGRDEKGEVILVAICDWLYVDTAAGRIARIPASFAAVTPEGTPHVTLSEAPAPDAKGWEVVKAVDITVRHSDIDVNQHANNTRFADWMFEPLEGAKSDQFPNRIDIVYKVGVRDADIVRSSISEEKDGIIRHRLTRASDGTLFAAAVSRWENCKI